ncbi:MAG: 3'-5' exonuclease [Actinomycetia bacterium]|nr:3'-5' exonuclease [Actinomycetes bacterium]
MALVMDTETTGLLQPLLCDNVYQPQLIEIYIGKFDEKTYEVYDEINTFIKPITKWGDQILLEDPVNDLRHITRITGIYDGYLTHAPTFDEVAEEVHNFCDGEDLLVAHNLMFDLEVMMHNFIRIGQPHLHTDFRRKCCTVEMSYPILKKRMKNDQLYKMATGQVMEGSHRAKVDSMATLTSFKWLREQGF